MSQGASRTLSVVDPCAPPLRRRIEGEGFSGAFVEQVQRFVAAIVLAMAWVDPSIASLMGAEAVAC